MYLFRFSFPLIKTFVYIPYRVNATLGAIPRIFTVAFLPFLVPAVGSNPAGQ